MKRELYSDEITVLKFFKNKMLMLNNKMFYIKDFKIEEEEVLIKSNWFRKEKTVKKEFLTSLDIVAYFPNYNTIGTMQEHDAINIITFYDIPQLRGNWITFKKQLSSFGINIDKKD